MKQCLPVIILLLVALGSKAQVPKGIRYQAVARDETGLLLTDQSINLKISITDSSSSGPVQYAELQKTTTNSFGLFSVTLGQGVPLSGNFATIPWKTGNKWLKIEIDPKGGNNFTFVGASELMSVPYALYAETSGNTDSGRITQMSFDTTTRILTITEAGIDHNAFINSPAKQLNDLTDVNAYPATGQVLKWDGTKWAAGNDSVVIQQLAIINNVLTLTGGNGINLAPYMQQLSFDTSNNILSLTNGGQADLSSLIRNAPTGAIGPQGVTGPTGAANISGLVNYVVKFSTDSITGGNSQIYDNGHGVGIGTTNPDSRLQINAAPGQIPLRVQSNGVTKFLIDNSGLVAIGNLPNPFYQLDVSNSSVSVASRLANTYAAGTGLAANGNGQPGSYLTNGSGMVGNGSIIGVAGLASNNTTMAFGGYFSNDGIYAYVGGWNLANNVFTPYKIIGNGAVSTIVENTQGEKITMFAPESPEVLFQDYGTGTLTNGHAHISMDPNLARNIQVDSIHPIKVFVQLEGACNGVYVDNKSANGFDVVELNNGNSSTHFSWSVVATRKNEMIRGDNGSKMAHFDVRFPPAPAIQARNVLNEK